LHVKLTVFLIFLRLIEDQNKAILSLESVKHSE